VKSFCQEYLRWGGRPVNSPLSEDLAVDRNAETIINLSDFNYMNRMRMTLVSGSWLDRSGDL